MIGSPGYRVFPVRVLVLASIALSIAAACGDGKPDKASTPVADAPIESTPAPAGSDTALIGRPQNRANMGNVELAFDRYEATHGDLVELFKSQAWFKDGLTREESLFVERSLTFVGRYSGPRAAYVSDETVKRKLVRYDRVDRKSVV